MKVKQIDKEQVEKRFNRMKLNKIIREDANKLKIYVAEYAVEEGENYESGVEGWFEDLAYGGCKSGFIGSLIYTKDCQDFYDKYYYEIEEIRQNWEGNNGVGLIIPSDHDLKNWLAWFAFEETARNLSYDIGFEI